MIRHERIEPRRPFRLPKVARTTVLFGFGLIVGAHEVLIRDESQVEVLIFAGGLLGLPLAFLADDLRAQNKEAEP
jgi:hypothetical protein